jgi:signal peptidase II
MSIARNTLDIPVRIGRKLAAHPIKAGGAVLAADLLSKSAVGKLPLYVPYCITQSSVCLEHLQNKNGAFGIHFPLGNTFTKFLLLGGTLSLAGLFVKAKSRLTKLATALIIGGSLGNQIERFAWGSVTDFIKLGSWPNFNLADASITAGCLMIAYEALVGTKSHTA